jgi:hypothetical protein
MKFSQPIALALVATTLLFGASAPANAGRNCEAQAPSTLAVQRGLNLAARTARALDATGAQVVVLARSGQDLSKYGLRWSHLGFAYREAGPSIEGATGASRDGASAPGVWRVVHKLNACGSATADVFIQGLGDFFLDDPFQYVAGIAVPTTEVQAKLWPLLQDKTRLTALHQTAYSMVAYPWSQTYQQSNQWAIETLAMSQEPSANTRERAQAWLRFKAYEPTTLRLNAMVRLGARLTAGNVAFDDHPNDKRYSDRIETVTADSVFSWLEGTGLAFPLKEVR